MMISQATTWRRAMDPAVKLESISPAFVKDGGFTSASDFHNAVSDYLIRSKHNPLGDRRAVTIHGPNLIGAVQISTCGMCTGRALFNPFDPRTNREPPSFRPHCLSARVFFDRQTAAQKTQLACLDIGDCLKYQWSQWGIRPVRIGYQHRTGWHARNSGYLGIQMTLIQGYLRHEKPA